MKIPVHNNTKMPMYVAGQMIPADEIRHFEEHQVPTHLRPAPEEVEEETPADPQAALTELIAGNVKSIVAALPDLSDADLEALGGMEQAAENPRKGVLGAIAEETLKRADAAASAAGTGGAGE